MKQQLTRKNIIGMSFMIFSMFLGAGNLIFPPLAGHLAGSSYEQAAIGFLITGAGLPLLGIIAISIAGGNFDALSRGLPRSVVILVGTFIFLIIGPLYAVPRTAMVAYEIGILPFEEHGVSAINRFIFCLLFFAITWYLSLNPGKLLESVGEAITPALIILLLVIGIYPLITPQSELAAPMAQYTETPLLHGFLEGYMTMDALAALMFGVVITTNLKSHGIIKTIPLARYSIITGSIAIGGLALVYLSLFYLGASTREMIQDPANGGQVLAIYVEKMMGFNGSVCLGAIAVMACLTSAIGCVTAAAKYFDEHIPYFSYKTLVTFTTIICITVANLGLNQIIYLFTPVLLLLYPMSITLILLTLIRSLLPNPRLSYRVTLATTLLFSLLDALKTPVFNLEDVMVSTFNFLPGFDYYLSWLLPSVIILAISCIVGKLYPEKKQAAL